MQRGAEPCRKRKKTASRGGAGPPMQQVRFVGAEHWARASLELTRFANKATACSEWLRSAAE